MNSFQWMSVWSLLKAGLKLFDHDVEFYLPMVFSYFEDISRSHFNKFCGELLSIEEFNEDHDLRKIDIDHEGRNHHSQLVHQVWFERMHVLHFFDHPKRFIHKERSAKIISSK